MNVVIAMDSFKGSLTSLEAGTAAAMGIHKVYPDAKVEIRPLADGGEGTVEALALGMQGRIEKIMVTGPLGRPVEAMYGVIDEKQTAIIEMAQAAGITLLEQADRNPFVTTTYGVGEMIKDAIEKGCRKFIVGIGGSSTNDGGIGMLQALGFGMLDEDGQQVGYGAKGARDLCTITDDAVIDALKECTFRIACDVTNPLCGAEGCSAIYGPQKGATPSMVIQMDEWLAGYAALVEEKYQKADRNAPGSGAAGGLGFAFLSFLDSRLESGIQIVLEETGLEEYIKEADLVITGEGKIDGQTAMGKAPMGVAKLAKKYEKKVIAFAGSVAEDADVCNEQGIDAFFSITPRVCSLEEAMQKDIAKQNMIQTVTQVMRLL